MKKKYLFGILFCTLLLLPTFWLNIRNYPDWGDDFAMYLKEASLISKNENCNKHQYISIPNTGNISPSSYPVGYPLLLSPVIHKYGLDYRKLFLFQTFFYVLMGIGIFFLFRRKFSFAVSFLATLLICYNPYLLNAKSELLSDIPFAAFFYVLLILYYYLCCQVFFANNKIEIKKNFLLILTAIGFGFLLHIRSAGFIFLGGIAFHLIINSILSKKLQQQLFAKIFFSGIIIMTYFVIKFIFPINSIYNGFFSLKDIYSNFVTHFTYYIEVLFGFLKYFDVREFGFVTHFFSSMFLSTILIGIIVELKRKVFSLSTILLITYFIFICCTNLSNSGYRLLIPLTYFFVYFSIIGLKQILINITNNYRFIGILACLILLLFYRHDVKKMATPWKYSSPNDEVYQPIFNYLNKSLNEKDTIASVYPRTFALYTHSNYYYNTIGLKQNDFIKEINKYHTSHIITFDGSTEPAIIEFIKKDTNQFKKIMSCNEICLYKNELYILKNK